MPPQPSGGGGLLLTITNPPSGLCAPIGCVDGEGEALLVFCLYRFFSALIAFASFFIYLLFYVIRSYDVLFARLTKRRPTLS